MARPGLGWAGSGMCVIVDLDVRRADKIHHHTGKANQNRFFKDRRHIEHTERIWANGGPPLSRSCGGRCL